MTRSYMFLFELVHILLGGEAALLVLGWMCATECKWGHSFSLLKKCWLSSFSSELYIYNSLFLSLVGFMCNMLSSGGI